MQHIPSLLFATCLLTTTAFAGVDYELELTGQNLQMGTLLTWSTLEEVTNEQFLIEKSIDGITFRNVGTVAGAGDSDDLLEYSFLDIMAATEMTYYRLKQVDTDGTNTLSKVVTVRQTYPNAFLVTSMSAASTSGLFELTVDMLEAGRLAYRLYDFGGALLEDHTLDATAGLQDLNFDLSAHPEGVYRVQLELGNEQENLYVRRIMDEFSAKPNVATKETGSGGRN